MLSDGVSVFVDGDAMLEVSLEHSGLDGECIDLLTADEGLFLDLVTLGFGGGELLLQLLEFVKRDAGARFKVHLTDLLLALLESDFRGVVLAFGDSKLLLHVFEFALGLSNL